MLSLLIVNTDSLIVMNVPHLAQDVNNRGNCVRDIWNFLYYLGFVCESETMFK